MEQKQQVQVQVIGQNPKSFPANNFFIAESGDDIICHFIYDDMSDDPATCVSVSITKHDLKVFVGTAKEIIGKISNYNSKFKEWDGRKKLIRETNAFRISLIHPYQINDVIHISLGYIHPLILDQARKTASDTIAQIQVPSLIEISFPALHFLRMYEKFSKIISE